MRCAVNGWDIALLLLLAAAVALALRHILRVRRKGGCSCGGCGCCGSCESCRAACSRRKDGDRPKDK